MRTRTGSGWSILGRRWRGRGAGRHLGRCGMVRTGSGQCDCRFWGVLDLGVLDWTRPLEPPSIPNAPILTCYLVGFDWEALSRGSVVVDVGGGIGLASMLLASAYAEADADGGGGLWFVIQDRPVVVEMGEKAWRTKCPELLESGAVRFQVHDFFTPQPVVDTVDLLLRVVPHDWPDAFAQCILREAAAPHTRLVLCPPARVCGQFWRRRRGEREAGDGGRAAEGLTEGEGEGEGAIGGGRGDDARTRAAPLGKASANAYWMDLTMQVTFNGQERTLREIVALALSAGWKFVRMTKASGLLFGHTVAVPVPPQRRARTGSGSAFFDGGGGWARRRGGAGSRLQPALPSPAVFHSLWHYISPTAPLLQLAHVSPRCLCTSFQVPLRFGYTAYDFDPSTYVHYHFTAAIPTTCTYYHRILFV
ncbi:hypothetical protein C8R44DRAFT_139154 [Mycena epipterygia]|nr:hypothetical protein C8R44DRAFT_139154 [Mycena epipterygia]